MGYAHIRLSPHRAGGKRFDNANPRDVPFTEVYDCDLNTKWTVVGFFRKFKDVGDEQGLCGKESAGTIVFHLRTSNAEPATLTHWDGSSQTHTAAFIETGDIWYLFALIADGSNGATDGRMLGMSMNGRVLAETTVDLTGEAGAHDFRLGRLSSDDFTMDMAHVALFSDEEFNDRQLLEYLYDPSGTAQRYGSKCRLYAPLDGSGTSTGFKTFDYSPYNNHSTVPATTVVVKRIRDPVIGPKRRLFMPEIAAAGGLPIPVAMANYRRQHLGTMH